METLYSSSPCFQLLCHAISLGAGQLDCSTLSEDGIKLMMTRTRKFWDLDEEN